MLQLALLSCQPKNSENTNSQPPTLAADSVRPEILPPDRTVTELDSVGEASSSPAPTLAPTEGEDP